MAGLRQSTPKTAGWKSLPGAEMTMSFKVITICYYGTLVKYSEIVIMKTNYEEVEEHIMYKHICFFNIARYIGGF